MTRVVLVAGTTETASIQGISAAGADSDLLVHTPSADAEILTYGEPACAPVVPTSPSGCPTPAVVTRAVREQVGFDVTVVDAGLQKTTGAPTVTVGAQPGGDIRKENPVPTASRAFESARQLGRALPDDELLLAESIPGGTTTALGVLRALGEHGAVSSSLQENPIEQKNAVVAVGLAASGMSGGGAAGEPRRAVERMGDPVLAVIAGLARGAIETEKTVTFAGGTQMLAAIALLRHEGVGSDLYLATTSFLVEDSTAGIAKLAKDLGVTITTTDPRFDVSNHPAMAGYVAGEAKEGVGMGGALALADRSSVPMSRVRKQVRLVYERLVEEPPAERSR